MRHRTARFLLLIVALWLPLQAMAGMAMNLSLLAAAQERMAMENCPYHSAMQAEPAGQHDGEAIAVAAPSSLPGCDACGVCQLSGVGYMPALATDISLSPAPRVYVAAVPVQLVSHLPEPPQIPPRRSH